MLDRWYWHYLANLCGNCTSWAPADVVRADSPSIGRHYLRVPALGTYHPKAIPVILTTQDEIETWLDAPAPIVLQLPASLPDDARGAG